jgi:ribosomal protein S18 acetylase RimI-like enzyme
VVDYRTFRNIDPPALVEVWNASLSGRGAVVLSSSLLLEYFTFSKPYFDPDGLIVALDGRRVVGFAHAGFAADASNQGLDYSQGVLCMLGVRPEYRGQKIGAELLRRAEEYLVSKGAKTLHAGPMAERFNPFTFGLYGGSTSPGFLDSDTSARGFLEHHGYREEDARLIFQKKLDTALNISDPRSAELRQDYEIHAGPFHTDWWGECILGPQEVHDFRLVNHRTREAVSQCIVWEMETFNPVWQQYAVGVIQLETLPEKRRQGFARFLLTHLMRHLQDQFFSVMEVQAAKDNAAAIGLLRNLGFEQVDTGRMFAKTA